VAVRGFTDTAAQGTRSIRFQLLKGRRIDDRFAWYGQTNFYITESGAYKQQVFYFRHDDWDTACRPIVLELQASAYEKLSQVRPASFLLPSTLSFSCWPVRLCFFFSGGSTVSRRTTSPTHPLLRPSPSERVWRSADHQPQTDAGRFGDILDEYGPEMGRIRREDSQADERQLDLEGSLWSARAEEGSFAFPITLSNPAASDTTLTGMDIDLRFNNLRLFHP
jgi:hypothetical protein